MTLVLKLMKSSFAAAGAVLIIALIIVFFGPRVGLVRPYNFLLAALVILCWLIWLVIKKVKAKKNAKAMEGFLSQQADDQLLTARPDVKDEIAALKEKMERAIKTLKKSKLARGRRGSEALYVLPWYMIIGPSACGKSTAIRNSGLSFPPIDPDSESPGAIKGLGGTRNCDWWFTNEGIVLDTAGRYTISVDAAEDREEWLSFLGLLKRFRKKTPINGLLVMVSVDELMQQSEEGIEAHANNIRRRIDELIAELEIIFPVYLIFTKCDLLSGFVEFFGDISKREREQVWGYTCKYGVERTSPVHEEFHRESEKLFATIKARGLRKLHGDLRPGDEKKVYLFPLEFDAARRKLTAFVETLFQPNPFQQDPALRGVYFTSGTQEGTPIGQVMEAMAQEFGLGEEMGQVIETPREPKAYFIRDLFSKIIMPDQARTTPTLGSAKRRKWMRLALASVLALATILLVLALATSYFGNRRLLAKTVATAENIEDVRGGRPSRLMAHLEKLEGTLEHLEDLDRYKEDGPPLSLRWGLYKGETVNRAARRALLGKITTLLMQPTVRKFERYLDSNAPIRSDGTENELFFDVATAYMMLTEPPESTLSDMEALVGQTEFVWGSAEDDNWRDEFADLAEPQVRYWWCHRAGPEMQGVVLEKNTEISRRVSREIADHWSVDRFYRKMIREANSRLRDFTVDAAVPGTTLLDGKPVRGAYTRAGWEDEVINRIEHSPAVIEQNPFLSRALADSKIDIRNELYTRYVQSYKRAWQEFFDGLEVSAFRDISEASEGLDELAAGDSPIIELLKKVAGNSKIKWDGRQVEEISDEFYGINEFLGRLGSMDDLTGASSENIKNYAEFLRNAIDELGEGEAALEEFQGCGDSYRSLARRLEREQKRAQRLISSSRSTLSRKASELLGKPFAAARAAAYRKACECVNEAWQSVYSQFKDRLAGKYPFSQYGSDASASDIVEFFGSGGAIDRFDKEEAQPAKNAGIGLSGSYSHALAVAHRIRRVITGNRLNVSFTLTARATGFKDMEKVTFILGNTELKYSMGSPRTRGFEWFGDEGGDCSLTISPMDRQQVPPLRESGAWALFRLLAKAEIQGNMVAWTFRYPEDVQYELGGSAAEFIQQGHFGKFSCPANVCGR